MSEPLTVACVWVRGHVGYTADYVTRLQNMVMRHIDRPCRFVCFTDRPEELGAVCGALGGAGLSTVQITPYAGVKAWWSKLELFNPAHAHALGDRVLYLDLDVLVVGGLGPIIDYEPRAPGSISTLALCPPGGDFRPFGYSTVRRFNSSVISFAPNVGLSRALYSDFRLDYVKPSTNPAGKRPPWGDQDWIGERAPDADAMPEDWFPRLSEIRGAPDDRARVVLCKKPKPHQAAEALPWVREVWR